MKKIISVFIAAFVSLLLCSGVFVSCSTKDDDSDTDRAYAEALSYTKLTNIATKIYGSGLYYHDNPSLVIWVCRIHYSY